MISVVFEDGTDDYFARMLVSEQLQNCSLSITYNFTATQRAGAAQLPAPVPQIMRAVSKVMTSTAYRV